MDMPMRGLFMPNYVAELYRSRKYSQSKTIIVHYSKETFRLSCLACMFRTPRLTRSCNYSTEFNLDMQIPSSWCAIGLILHFSCIRHVKCTNTSLFCSNNELFWANAAIQYRKSNFCDETISILCAPHIFNDSPRHSLLTLDNLITVRFFASSGWIMFGNNLSCVP